MDKYLPGMVKERTRELLIIGKFMGSSFLTWSEPQAVRLGAK